MSGLSLAESIYEKLVLIRLAQPGAPKQEELIAIATSAYEASGAFAYAGQVIQSQQRVAQQRAAAEKERERQLLIKDPTKLPRDAEGNILLKYHR